MSVVLDFLWAKHRSLCQKKLIFVPFFKSNHMNYKHWNNIIGWVVFLISAVVYLMTIEATASFWDCGEFIATAFKLEVGHPPGAPLFMIMGRIFSLFAGGNVENVPVMINSMSALASAFTILFLFWTITHFAKKMVAPDGKFDLPKILVVLGSGVVGALAYAFSDSFWFSAVEAEVYASSSLFTAIVFWAICKWENVSDQRYANRWLIFIAYIMGLSVGVHLLNLLAIPAIVFVYYFKKSKVTTKGVISAAAISMLILVAIMYGIIPGVFKVASGFELLFVNSWGMSFNMGLYFYLFLLLISGVVSIYLTHIEGKRVLQALSITVFVVLSGIPMMVDSVLFWIFFAGLIFFLVYQFHHLKAAFNTILLSIFVILIGYSTFAMIIIRSSANPPMDENNPENVFSLISYLNREQYGDRPLFYGQYYCAPLDSKDPVKLGNPVYIQDDGKYVQVDQKESYNYDSRFCSVFPRMFSTEAQHIRAYKEWANIKGIPINATNNNGEVEKIYKPTFGENLAYFFKYQVGHMYLRYFMWNFAGRQNDIQGHGGILHGNWLSGINALDEMRLGPQDNLPSDLKNNKARNTYFFLPLILGLLGMFFHMSKEKNGFWSVMLLFILTGLAIVVYLNQYPYQPRERDYAYTGSFYAFCIWIGFGVTALYTWLSKYKLSKTVLATGVIIASFIAVPLLMANQNWDDHDRSQRYTARDFAKNYLNSCEKDAILFTNGDNDTFPLWYAQEVEGVRTDVRVVNLSLFNTDWYVDQMKRKAYDSDPIPNSFKHEQYVQGTRDYLPVMERIKGPVDLKKVMEFIKSDLPDTRIERQGGKSLSFVPTKSFYLPVDLKKILGNNTVSLKDSARVLDKVEWSINKNYILKADLMVLDMLAENNWNRPIYFAITVGSDSYLKLENFFRLDGLAYRFVPVNSPSKDGQIGYIDTDILYDRLMNKFVWGNISNPNVYLDENNLRMAMNFRNNFARLALALLDEGKRDSAVAVLDKCLEVMPEKTVPYNYFVLGIAEGYYRAGEMVKANEIMEKMYEVTKGELDYYLSLEPRYAKSVQTEARRSMAVYQEILRITNQYRSGGNMLPGMSVETPQNNADTSLYREMEDAFKIYYDKYTRLYEI
ncbi:MAG: hypothetical protein CVU05_00745 [Bacteroidetes bacterium HGW-Bacteroidetes-21]|nr:MAG: hypothetical protein CVU05_00745 [Bacteroidetes bacterium HGW-Bacteroidetes-21]